MLSWGAYSDMSIDVYHTYMSDVQVDTTSLVEVKITHDLMADGTK